MIFLYNCLKVFQPILGVFLLFFSTVSFSQISLPQISAKSWMVFDVNSRQILASSHPDDRIEPASLTKLMSTYVVFDALKTGKIFLEQKVIPSASILRVKHDESRSFIVPNKPVSVNALIHGMVTQSGNDATIALAELIAGDEFKFVAMMNDKAHYLGMRNTNYTNVNGLPSSDHYTTVRDLVTLSYALMHDFADYYSIFSEREFSLNKIKQKNRNRLLWLDKTVDGLKTGYTAKAGYCLIATAKRPLSGIDTVHHRVITVLVGSLDDNSRTRDSLKLLNYAYQSFRTFKIHSANEMIDQIPIYYGKTNQVGIGTLVDQFISIPVDEIGVIKISLNRKKWLIAPVKKGEQIGFMTLSISEKKIKKIPLVVLHDIPAGNFFKRLKDFCFFYL